MTTQVPDSLQPLTAPEAAEFVELRNAIGGLNPLVLQAFSQQVDIATEAMGEHLTELTSNSHQYVVETPVLKEYIDKMAGAIHDSCRAFLATDFDKVIDPVLAILRAGGLDEERVQRLKHLQARHFEDRCATEGVGAAMDSMLWGVVVTRVQHLLETGDVPRGEGYVPLWLMDNLQPVLMDAIHRKLQRVYPEQFPVHEEPEETEPDS